MRLAQIMLAKGFGGAERSFVDLTQTLVERGHDVLAIGERRGVALSHLEPHARLTCASVTCRGAWDRLSGYRIGRLLADYAPALVQAHLARAALIGGRAARRLGLPALAKTHDLVDLRYYRHLDVLVPTTLAQGEYLEQHGITPAALVRIPNFSRLAAVDAPPPVPAGPPHLKALGRFVQKKGFDLLIEAAAMLVQAGRRFTLTIGGDGPERGALAAAIARAGLSDQVTLSGWVDDVAAFLADATLFVLPSRDEPFGIVVLEAMACGIGIVTTPTAGPCEVLDADTALIGANISAAALATSIALALDDPAATAARALRALARYREDYAAEAVVAQYEALYARMLATRE